VAEAITAVAREHHIPLHEDPNLVEVLEAMDIDLEVPPALYRAVAEVLAFVYRVNGKLKT
jgi:flagellar biosynthesis protein